MDGSADTGKCQSTCHSHREEDVLINVCGLETNGMKNSKPKNNGIIVEARRDAGPIMI